MYQSIEGSHEATLILYQAIPSTVFHPDSPVLSPRVLTVREKWPALPARTKNAHTAQALTETASPNDTTPASIRIGKVNLNSTQLMNGKITSPRPTDYPERDVMLETIFVGSNSDSEYIKSTKNSPLISANTPELAGQISKLEMIHKVSVVKIKPIV